MSDKKYDRDKLGEICSQIDLLEYASKNIKFKKRGSDSFAAHCPRHTDNTASLIITPSKNLFYCQSCHIGGNIITWMMTFEHITFNDAVDRVAKFSGVDIYNIKISDSLKLFKTIKECTVQEHSNDNLDRFILPDDEMEKYSEQTPKEWVEEGILPDIMSKFNIRIDDTRNRIIYPVYDNNLNLIGIKGRTRYENYKELNIRKYTNYTKIKRTDFFVGMKENWESIQKHNEIIIFEGIKSVLKVTGWGYDYSVSSETSWLNDFQIRILIERKIKNVVIAFDNDVELEIIIKCTKILKRYTNVYTIIDYKKRLGDKAEKKSPCDEGEKVWEILYKEKRRLR